MTLVADIPAPRVSPHGGAPSRPDSRIAVAEMWLCMLRALSHIARRFSGVFPDEVAPATWGARGPIPIPRAFRDPVAAFCRAGRALRLAFILSMKIADELKALRAGAPLDVNAFLSRAPRAIVLSKADREAAAADRREDNAEDRENLAEIEVLHEREAPERLAFLGGLERLGKSREFETLLNGPLKDAIASICRDLGLKPDWSLWTDNGFPPPPGGRVEDWIAFFVPNVPSPTGDMAREAPPGRIEPRPPPREPVRDPRRLLDSPTRRLHEVLAAAGIEPRPPPPGARRTFGAYPPIP